MLRKLSIKWWPKYEFNHFRRNESLKTSHKMLKVSPQFDDDLLKLIGDKSRDVSESTKTKIISAIKGENSSKDVSMTSRASSTDSSYDPFGGPLAQSQRVHAL